jgi:hypothetical protein
MQYSGPVAHVLTTSQAAEGGVNYFYISAIDGNSNFKLGGPSITEGAEKASKELADVSGEVDVPARTAQFTLNGTTVFRAPIICMANPAYRFSESTAFTPITDHTYIILGSMNATGSTISIEDLSTKTTVAKVEKAGSSAASMGEKVMGSACSPSSYPH